MNVMSEVDLIYNFVKWILFHLVNYVYTLLRNLKWRRDGIYWRHQDPDSYDRCVHVMKVQMKHRIDAWLRASLSDFVLSHERFDSPDILLGDDVSLYDINESHAVFVQARPDWPKRAIDADFFILGQFAGAGKVLTMPLKHFWKFADELKDDGAKMIFIQNQARCGGTLMMSIFRETGQCVCFSEPHCVNTVCQMIFSRHQWHGQRAKEAFRRVVRVLCKPYHGLGHHVLAYVIKPSTPSIVSTELTQQAFPDCSQLFMYRDPVPLCRSMRRAGEAVNTFKLFYHLPNIPNLASYMTRLTGYVDNEFRNWTCAIHQELEFGYRVACFAMYYYFDNLRRGVGIRGVRYEHLVSDPEKMIGLIFKACGLPDHLASKSSEAMKRDSQKASPISRDMLKMVMPNPPKATPEFLEVAKQLADEYGVPGPDLWKDESFHLENSLVPSNKSK